MAFQFSFESSPSGGGGGPTAGGGSAAGFNAAFSSLEFASASAGSTPSSGSSSLPNFGRKSPKDGIDQEKSRRMREEKLNQIRKDRRNDHTLLLRRRFVEESQDDAAAAAVSAMSPGGHGHGHASPLLHAAPPLHMQPGQPQDQTRVLFQQHQQARLQQQQEAKAQHAVKVAEHEANVPPPPVSAKRLEEMPSKIAWLYGHDFEQQKEALIFFRKMLAQERQPPVELVVSSGVVPRLIEFLSLGCDESLQFEAAWAATNIACAELRYSRVMIENHVIPALVTLVAMSDSDRVREQATWALSNISSDVETREQILQSNALAPIMWQLGIEKPPHRQQVVQPALGTMQHISLLLANLSRGGASGHVPMPQMVVIIDALAELLQSPDEAVYCNVASAIAEVCEKSDEHVQMVLERGLLSKLYELLTSCPKAREFCVRAFCGVMRSTSDLQVRLVMSSRYPGLLAMVLEELARPDAGQDPHSVYRANNLRCEICLTLGRLMEVDQKYSTALLHLGLLPTLLSAAERGAHDLATQAANCLCLLLLHAEEGCLPGCLSALRVFPAILGSFNGSSPDQLHMTLSALHRVASTPSCAPLVDPAVLAVIRDWLAPLIQYPLPEISQLAGRVEGMLEAGDA